MNLLHTLTRFYQKYQAAFTWVQLILALTVLATLVITDLVFLSVPSPVTSPLALPTLHSPLPLPDLTISPSAPSVPSETPTNLDFESPTTSHWAYYYTPSGGPYYAAFGETNSPEGWTPIFFDGFPCPGDPSWLTGRPEYGLITKNVDASRVYSGNQALKFFTFHRCHIAGVFQRFPTIPGATYKFTIYPQVWASNCSSKPHYTECPLDWDCVSCMYPDHTFYVGLDPEGGIDPLDLTPSQYVTGVGMYGQYSVPLSVMVTATGYTMTAHLLSIDPLPWRHNDVYADHATIERVYLTYLPLLIEEGE